MNLANIPNDKRDAEIHLKSRKLAYEEFLIELKDDEYKNNSLVCGWLYNEIEKINELLGV